MTRIARKRIIVLILWILTMFLTPFAQPAVAQGSDRSFMSADLDADGLPNGVEEEGWCNSAGCFQTYTLDSDSDDDGLTDGQEKLFETNPLDDRSPGVYVEYENQLKTRQYFARDSHSPAFWGWQQHGDRFISTNAVVVRRGASFSVGGPADATIQVVKSLDTLTTITPVRDACGGRWRITVPTGGTVGKYTISLQKGEWSRSLNLYVIFELPTPDPSFTQEMIDAFVYDDNPGNRRDEKGILLGDYQYDRGDMEWIPEGAWINAGTVYQFNLQPFEPFVFEEHVIEAINGDDNQWDAADDLVHHTDKVTRFLTPRPRFSSWEVLHPGSDDRNQCSNIAGLLTAFQRSAGIPARVVFIDDVDLTFDHSAEVWLNGDWYTARGYEVLGEPGPCGWDCANGIRELRSRQAWGQEIYVPWHSFMGQCSGWEDCGSIIMTVKEDWSWPQTAWVSDPSGHDYRWPSWDWNAIVRHNWAQTVFEPYWSHWGWSEEPQVTGTPPDDWPMARDFSIDVSPDSQVVGQTQSASYNIALTPSNDFDNPVEIYINPWDLPDNASYSVEPDNQCVPDCNRTLAIHTTAGTPTGTHNLPVHGYSGGLYHTKSITLEVTSGPIAMSAGAALPGAMSADGQAGLAIRGVQDYGVDRDGDGYYDQLVIVIEIDAAQPGSYWLLGELGLDQNVPILAPAGGLIDVAVDQADLAQGLNTLELTFEGLHISASKVDGPYVLKHLSITDVEDPTREDFTYKALGNWSSLYTTASYRAYDFQNRGALLSDDITEIGLDADGDGLYEALTLNVGLIIFQPGTYRVQGDLYDSRGQFVAGATWTGTGSTASLQFEELAGTTGPYTLEEIYLFNAESEDIDSMYQLYTTQQVTKAEIKTHIVDPAGPGEMESEAILPGPYSDAGVDTDGDGKYDQLRITTSLVIEDGEGGQAYRVEGWLVDSHGSLISWAISDPQVLDVGTHTMNLIFDGRIINEHGVDGPFTLVALKILPGSSYSVLDEVPVAHTTSSYNHADFEAPLNDPEASTVFWDDMESGAGKWTAGTYWDLSQNKWHSYSHSWEADLSGSQTSDLTTIGLDAPADLDLILKFRTCYAMGSFGDVGHLQASINGSQWTSLASYTGSTPGWNTEFLDLSQFEGASDLQLRFEAASQNRVLWYVDDVVVVNRTAMQSTYTYLPIILK